MNYFLVIFVLLVTQLHLLRNVSPFYVLLYLSASVCSLFVFNRNFAFFSQGQRFLISLVALLFFIPCISVLFGAASGYYESGSEILIGLSRLFFTFPICLAILSIPLNVRVSDGLFLWAGVLTCLASLSIVYQYFSGPIWWFAESSERSGMPRYASLLGSLTALGVVCGAGLLSLAVSMRSTFYFSIFSVLLSCGAVMSLQKAAVVNLALATLLVPLVRKIRISAILWGGMVFFGGALFFVFYFGEQILGYLGSFRIGEGQSSSYTDDVSLIQSVFERFLDLPLVAISFFGFESLLLGVGPVGASGSLGFPHVPMTHNGIFDLFLVGGVGYFFFVFVLVFSVLLVGFRGRKGGGRVSCAGGWVVFLILLNSLFSGLLFFSPSGAMFFAIGLRAIFEISDSEVRDV